MEKECPKCNESLKKGVAYRLSNGALSVRFDKVDSFDRLQEPILSPYVCLKCGYVEWGIEKVHLLN